MGSMVRELTELGPRDPFVDEIEESDGLRRVHAVHVRREGRAGVEPQACVHVSE